MSCFGALIFLYFACDAVKFENQDEPEEGFLQRPDGENQPTEDPSDDPKDIDQDGYTVEDGDCDDWDPNVHPNAREIWNYQDDDCDGFEDVDGVHSGSLNLQAQGIYDSEEYLYDQSCDGTINRLSGHLSMNITCSIDHSQELAEQMLGGTLTVSTEVDFVNTLTYSGSVLFTSIDGVSVDTQEGIEWDSQGELTVQWSSLEENSGDQISVEAVLQPWTGHLAIQIIGTLYRQ